MQQNNYFSRDLDPIGKEKRGSVFSNQSLLGAAPHLSAGGAQLLVPACWGERAGIYTESSLHTAHRRRRKARPGAWKSLPRSRPLETCKGELTGHPWFSLSTGQFPVVQP